MSGSLPPPRDGTQRYLKAIHDRLGDVEGRLKDLLDRTPAPPPTGGEGEVELREPAASAPEDGRGVSSGPVEDKGGPGASKRPARSTPRKPRTVKPPAEAEPAAVTEPKAPTAKPAPRRATKTTTSKPTPKKDV